MINYSVAMFPTTGNIALICSHELTVDKIRIWHSFTQLVARWVRGFDVTTESLKRRIYADNRHLTSSNIFPCTLIFLYAETGEKAKRHTRHIWQPICTLWFLTAKSSTWLLRRQNCFFRFFSVRIECHTEKQRKIAENWLIKNCDLTNHKITLSVGKGCCLTYIYYL